MPRRKRSIVAWLARAVAVCLLVSAAAVVVYRFVPPPLTPLMVIRMVEGLASGERVGISKRWVALDDVSPALLRAVIAAEDARFFLHRGVDLDAVERARDFNIRQRGKRLRGASTITMQCARNVFLWQGRSWFRKTLEVYFTALLELVWSKRRILEVYLNVVEWGPGIYGVDAAARHHFGVAAADLDPYRAALLAAALPDPRRANPAAPSPYLRARANIIAARAARVRLHLLNVGR